MLSLALATALACGSAPPRPASGAEPVLELREGATVTGVAHPEQLHVYPLTINEGTYVEFHLDRSPRALGVHLFEAAAPADAPSEAASSSGEVSAEVPGQVLGAVVPATGEYEIRVKGATANPAPYRLTVAIVRAASETDWSRHHGLRVYEEAKRLEDDGQLHEALARFLEARELFARGGYARGVAATYSLRARILQSEARWEEARAEYLNAMEQWARGGDQGSVAGTLVRLGHLERERRGWEQASAYLDQALALTRDLGARGVEANALSQHCLLSVDSGRYDRGIGFCGEALVLHEELRRHRGTVEALLGLASIYRFRGELDTARSYLLRAQDVLAEHPDPRQEATVHNDFANLLKTEGRYLAALGRYQKALESYEALRETLFAGTVLMNMGTIYNQLGDLDTSLAYYRQSLARLEGAENYPDQVYALHGVGLVLLQKGELGQAQEVVEKALEIARSWRNAPLLAESLGMMGELHVANGRPREAIAALEQALALQRSSGNRWREPSIQAKLSRAHLASGDATRALELLAEAAAGYEESGTRSGVAESFSRIAEIERDLGELDAARRSVEHAVAVAESMRAQVGSDELRTLYSATTRPYYELYVDILMAQHERAPNRGHDAEALRESERARARSLLEILPESDLDLAQQVPEALLAERASLRHRLNAKEIERQNLLEAGTADAGDLFRLKLDLEGLLTELQEVERRIRGASPRYAALTRPQPVTVGEIQRSLLEPETALLEYLLGDERSFLWVVTNDGFRSYQLPSRQEIETRARCVHWSITAYGAPPVPEELGPEGARCLGDDLASYRATPPEMHVLRVRAHRRQVLRAAHDRLAQALSTTLLGSPAREGLLPFRLAVVSDGALEYVPFAALPSPGAGGDPLVMDHEILRLPSASVLAFQRSQTDPSRVAASGVAIVADPVYGATDARLARARLISRRTGDSTTVRDGGSVLPDFARLDFSGQEAEGIAALAPASRVVIMEGFEASGRAVVGGALSGFRYVHFATHGVIDTQYPQLSSLVLSLVDRTGAPDESGYLRLHDIYGLDLKSADLVVLSACETALGREVRGEGLVGLTRGFLYAGAERVVASLWQVQDRATADLMERMYRGLLEEGRSPADALRRAQIETRDAEDGKYASPYYWAGFVLQGEWR